VSLSYRVTQFWWNITAEPLPDLLRLEIDSVLSSGEKNLFYQLQLSDQWHAYRVYSSLQEAGQTQPDLLAAAFLHDLGKSRMTLSVWDRILIVVADRLMPQKAKNWGQGDLHSWKRPFVVRYKHAQWGAEMARSAGSSALAIALIRRHQDPLPRKPQSFEDELLGQLQWADDLN
jgi:hypothetical protein